MKTVLLVKHTHISDKINKDIPLSRPGMELVNLLSDQLRMKRVNPQAIYSSSAQRALSTSRIIARRLRMPLSIVHKHDELFKASKEQIISFIRSLDENLNTVMLVAHEPAMGELINELSHTPITDYPTAATMIVNYGIERWAELDDDSDILNYSILRGLFSEHMSLFSPAMAMEMERVGLYH